MNWSLYPFIRLIIPFIIGIYIQYLLPSNKDYTLLISIIFIFCVASLFLLNQGKSRLTNKVWAYLFILTVCLLGYLKPQTNLEIQPLQPLPTKAWIVQINRVTTLKKYCRLEVAVKVRLASNKKICSTRGKVLVYLPIADAPLAQPGTFLLIDSPSIKPISIQGVSNNFFNWQYYYLRYFFYQTTLKKDNYSFLGRSNKISFFNLIHSLRTFLIEHLSSYVQSKEIKGVIAALVLGEKKFLPKALKTTYAQTGSIHVLAISGLHIGILSLLFSRFLKIVLPQKMQNSLASTLILCSLLWLFALLSGASPSVLRACCMFSLLIWEETYPYRKNRYNSLAASAFLLLWMQPNYLFQIGFQLSYAAVIGIVVLHKDFEQLVNPPHFFLKKIWSMLSVSFAAQTTTLPISLYYFHYFPNYFWLSSLIAIPLAALILCLGIGFFSLGYFPPLGKLFSWILYQCIYLMNRLIHYCSELPYGTINDIYPSKMACLFYYGFLLFFILHKKRGFTKREVFMSLTFLLSFLIFLQLSLCREIALPE